MDNSSVITQKVEILNADLKRLRDHAHLIDHLMISYVVPISFSAVGWLFWHALNTNDLLFIPIPIVILIIGYYAIYLRAIRFGYHKAALGVAQQIEDILGCKGLVFEASNNQKLINKASTYGIPFYIISTFFFISLDIYASARAFKLLQENTFWKKISLLGSVYPWVSLPYVIIIGFLTISLIIYAIRVTRYGQACLNTGSK